MVDLSLVWFGAIGILFTGFLFLEGFDFGVGALVPFVGRTDEERRIAIGTIGPVWDGNEVWLLTAGGAMFAAFPYWYATMFSGFYLALFVVLACLIIRGVTFEFRHQVSTKKWQNGMDWALSISSFLCAVLFPVAFANLIAGTPLDMVNGHLDFVGNFFDLLTPYTLLAGVAGAAFFLYHGSVYLSLKSSGAVWDRSVVLGKTLGAVAIAVGGLFAVYTALKFGFGKPISAVAFSLAVIMLLVSYKFFLDKGFGKALLCNGLGVIFALTALFTGLFPYVMISSIDPVNLSLTLAQSSSSPYTLGIMTVTAVILLPVVLGYQYWTFRVFKGRVQPKDLNY